MKAKRVKTDYDINEPLLSILHRSQIMIECKIYTKYAISWTAWIITIRAMGIGKEEDDLDLAEDLCLWVEEGRQVRDELQHDLVIIDDTCTGGNGGDGRL